MSSRAGIASRPGTRTTEPGRVAGILLAAGSARRMGSPKQLLELDGRPLLQHALDHALASRLVEIVVVLGAEAETVEAGLELRGDVRVRVVRNPDHALGQSSSLVAGLAALGPEIDAAAILLGDQPDVSEATIDRLLQAWQDTRARVMRPIYSQRHSRRTPAEPPIPGHPVILAREVWPELSALGGDAGARTLIQQHPDWLEAIELEGVAPPDIDTPEDYQRRRNTRHSPPDRSA